MWQAQEVGWDSILDSMNIWRFGSFDIFHFNLRCQLEKRYFPKHPWVAIINYTENQYKSKDFANRFLVATKHWKLPAVHICPRFAPRAVTLPGSCMREGGNTSTASPPASTKSATVFPPGCPLLTANMMRMIIQNWRLPKSATNLIYLDMDRSVHSLPNSETGRTLSNRVCWMQPALDCIKVTKKCIFWCKATWFPALRCTAILWKVAKKVATSG